ncbi:hypothetical protein ACJZ2D_010257 [Fusarium nematophilum]
MWLRRCLETHADCKASSSAEPALPTRVTDVLDNLIPTAIKVACIDTWIHQWDILITYRAASSNLTASSSQTNLNPSNQPRPQPEANRYKHPMPPFHPPHHPPTHKPINQRDRHARQHRPPKHPPVRPRDEPHDHRRQRHGQVARHGHPDQGVRQSPSLRVCGRGEPEEGEGVGGAEEGVEAGQAGHETEGEDRMGGVVRHCSDFLWFA